MLYRHFSSKEEIFYASVVEPLHLPIDAFLRRAQPPAVRMTRAERLTFMSTVMSDMVDQLAENMPALGLVLFFITFAVLATARALLREART